MSLERVLAGAGGLAAALYLFALAADRPTLALAVKPIPALMLAAWVLSRGQGPVAIAVAVGLVLSACGDALLEFDHLFVAGLGAFLLAHIAYTVGFTLDTRALALARGLPFAVYAVVMFLFLRPKLGPMAVPVALYAIAIGTMMWRASALVGAPGAPQQHEMLALGGAVVFAASDTLIALDRFHARIPHVHVAIIVLYWIGQLGIAASVALRR